MAVAWYVLVVSLSGVSKMEVYWSLKAVRSEFNEYNDCSVIALAAVTTNSYEYVHGICAKHNRQHRQGMYNPDILAAVNTLGYDYFKVSCYNPKTNCRLTPKTVGTRYTAGNYLCFVKGHVFALVDGVVEDWTSDRKHRIFAIYQVRRKVGS